MLPIVPVTASPIAVAPSPSTLGSSVTAYDANIVPTSRQTVHGIASKSASETLARDYQRHSQPMVLRHPRQAPSAVSSEQFLSARSLLAPAFQHSVMATKIAHISNLHAEAPRFRDQVDILA